MPDSNKRKRRRKQLDELNPSNWKDESTLDDLLEDKQAEVLRAVRVLQDEHVQALAQMRERMRLEAKIAGTETQSYESIKERAEEIFKRYELLVDREDELFAMLNGRLAEEEPDVETDSD